MIKFIQKLTPKTVNLYKIELIYASIYLLAGKILDTFVGKGITVLSMSFLTTILTILLIIFFRQHAYGQEKPMLAVLSIYYKSAVYVAIIFIIGNFHGKDSILVVAGIALIVYGILSYIFGKKYNEILSAYLYFQLIVLAKFGLFYL
jgi:hypothetical protein